jgi:hypothetical protein
MATLEISTRIIFRGDDRELKDLLYYHCDVVEEIWDAVKGTHNASILVNVSQPDARQVLEWPIQIRSPRGIKSLVARRVRPTSPIHIVTE